MKNFIKEVISRIVESELSSVNIQLNTLTNNIKNKQEEIDNRTDEILKNFKKIRTDIEILQKEIENIKASLIDEKKQVESSLKEMGELAQNISDNNTQVINQIQSHTEQIQDNISRLNDFSENIKNNNIEMDTQRKYFADYSINLKNNNEELAVFRAQMKNFLKDNQATTSKLTSFEKVFSSYSINLKNNNQLMDQVLSQIADYKKLTHHLEKGIITLQKEFDSSQKNFKINDSHHITRNITTDPPNSYDYHIDYLDFENHFRGSRNYTIENQKQYLKFFTDRSNVVDIGCGRGEFLELLNSHNIKGTGVDFNEDCVAYCKSAGFNVVMDDCLHFLRKIEFTDGIFAGQIVEHLTTEQLLEFCHLAYKKLEKNSFLVIETPNPTSLAIYTNAFFIDPSHIRPVHPLFLEYCLRDCGFEDIQIIYTENSKLPDIPLLQCPNMESVAEFNEAMKTVSKTLFGSQDYAIVARKE